MIKDILSWISIKNLRKLRNMKMEKLKKEQETLMKIHSQLLDTDYEILEIEKMQNLKKENETLSKMLREHENQLNILRGSLRFFLRKILRQYKDNISM